MVVYNEDIKQRNICLMSFFIRSQTIEDIGGELHDEFFKFESSF